METILRTDITVREICEGFIYNELEGKGLFGLNGKLTIQPEYQRNYIYADGKKVAPEIRESYSYPFKEDQHLDWITETDINFDGIPDLYLFTGFHSHAQSAYAAYVWNPATLQFYRVDTFDEIAEPEFDEKSKTITSRARDNGHMYIDVFKWKNGKLSRISSKEQPLFD